MEREKLELTREEALDIVCGDTFDFDIIEDVIDSTSRWSELHRIIVQRKSDSKYFRSYYSKGSTEMQMELPYEYDEHPSFTEVIPTEKIITVYE